MVIFFIFSQKTDFNISCKLSPLETICTRCQNLFSREKYILLTGNNKKKNQVFSFSTIVKMAANYAKICGRVTLEANLQQAPLVQIL